jgi:MFS family permease
VLLCTAEHVHPSLTGLCFSARNRQRSIVSEFDLVCDMSWASQAVNSCYFVGFLVGAGLWGMVSDRIGE